jgi:hypothetical protein
MIPPIVLIPVMYGIAYLEVAVAFELAHHLSYMEGSKFISCEEPIPEPKDPYVGFTDEQTGYIKARRWTLPLSAVQLAKLP